jgi:hypothetical protein
MKATLGRLALLTGFSSMVGRASQETQQLLCHDLFVEPSALASAGIREAPDGF